MCPRGGVQRTATTTRHRHQRDTAVQRVAMHETLITPQVIHGRIQSLESAGKRRTDVLGLILAKPEQFARLILHTAGL